MSKLLYIFIIIYIMCAIWVGKDRCSRGMNPTEPPEYSDMRPEGPKSGLEASIYVQPIQNHSEVEIGDSKAHTGVK